MTCWLIDWLVDLVLNWLIDWFQLNYCLIWLLFTDWDFFLHRNDGCIEGRKHLEQDPKQRLLPGRTPAKRPRDVRAHQPAAVQLRQSEFRTHGRRDAGGPEEIAARARQCGQGGISSQGTGCNLIYFHQWIDNATVSKASKSANQLTTIKKSMKWTKLLTSK